METGKRKQSRWMSLGEFSPMKEVALNNGMKNDGKVKTAAEGGKGEDDNNGVSWVFGMRRGAQPSDVFYL